MNIYSIQARNALPRVLSMFDQNKISNTFGLADREYWAWAIKDFANGTYQGAVHGLSILKLLNSDEKIKEENQFIEFMDGAIKAIRKIQNNDGSLNEAFPEEHSWCTTGLVAYDLLTTIKSLDELVPTSYINEWLEISSKLISHVVGNFETHAFISNHLLANANAMLLWNEITGDKSYERKSLKLVRDVIESGEGEGWFREYGGADPGYQTISMNYLANIKYLRPDWVTDSEIEQALKFLSEFINSDGSYSGVFGSRQTRFYFPAGIRKFARDYEIAFWMDAKLQESIALNQVVTLSAIDNGNLIHMFNNYCEAGAVELESVAAGKKFDVQEGTRVYKKAGILVDVSHNHKTIISGQKGGIVQHFGPDGNFIDCGLVLKKNNKVVATTQGNYESSCLEVNDHNTIELDLKFNKINKRTPNVLHTIAIRLLTLSVLRNRFIRNCFKNYVVKTLIKRNKSLKSKVTRKITLGERPVIKDNYLENRSSEVLRIEGIFLSSHMASAGYWQVQDLKVI